MYNHVVSARVWHYGNMVSSLSFKEKCSRDKMLSNLLPIIVDELVFTVMEVNH